MNAGLSFLLYAQLDKAILRKIFSLYLERSSASSMSHLLNNVRPLNREDTIFSEGGKCIALDSKINYRVRARSGRPKDEVVCR
jgi:hypothetical protein